MKKVSIILAALVLFGFSSYAEGNETMKTKRSIKEQVFEKVDVSVHEAEGNVIVLFEVSEDNTMVIHQINTENKELETYVRECLLNAPIDVEDNMKGKVFEIELNFYLL